MNRVDASGHGLGQLSQPVPSTWFVRCLLLLLVQLPWVTNATLVYSEPLTVREIEPPAEWAAPEQSGRWITTTQEEWSRFQRGTKGSEINRANPAPVLMNATYRAEFDGESLGQGEFQWEVHRLTQEPGFVTLGQSTLSVSNLQWENEEAIHGRSPSGNWMLWCRSNAKSLTGRWTQGGITKLGRVVYRIALPPALSSRMEIQVPAGWEASIPGVLGQRLNDEMNSSKTLWSFDLGRQQRFELLLEQEQSSRKTSILLREDTVYSLTNTDDLIRMRTDLECTVSGARHVDLQLTVPKTLRVFNVLLGNEVPLTFQRELGSEEDQLRIPLHSLQSGQRVTLRILSETQRRSDRSFIFPRLRPINALLKEGMIRLAVDRPLEVRGVETSGLRQIQLAEESGQEIRTYEMTSIDCLLALQVGEPAAQLRAEVLFLADIRGDSPIARSLVTLSTREGELFTPQLLVPSGWDVISVEMAPGSEISPAAWQVVPGPVDDSLLTLELKQPIRPDRDCKLLIELRSVQQRPTGTRRLPVPVARAVQSCDVRGVVWDHAPWELDVNSTGSIEVVVNPSDEELKQAVSWPGTVTPSYVATGIHVSRFDQKTRPLFRLSSVSPTAVQLPAFEGHSAHEDTLVLASLEVETRTSRVGLSHPHRAVFKFSGPVTPAAFTLQIAEEADLARVSSDDRDISFVRRGKVVILDPAAKAFNQLVLEYRTSAMPGWIVSRDEIVFPQLDCPVTDFAWHLVLNSERMLYRLPLTAASTPRQQMRAWERFIGPLARHQDETWFNPFRSSDWQSLINGSVTASGARGPNDIWLVAAQIPPQLTMKTWDLDVAHSLGWCGLLGALALGVALRRARSNQFRRSWIYLSGVFLVVSVFVAEPYAPVAGGAFLGSLLAILVPRRFAIGRDWLSMRRGQGRSSINAPTAVVSSLLIGLPLWAVVAISQDTSPPPVIDYFQVPGVGSPRIAFDAVARPAWTSWKETVDGPGWLLTSSEFQLMSDPTGPPRMTGLFRFVVFDRQSHTALRLPLAGVSLDLIEGVIDGQPVRLIPAADRSGFVLPLPEQKPEPTEEEPQSPPSSEETDGPEATAVSKHEVVLRFRPLPGIAPEMVPLYTASLPPVPESVVTLHGDRWWISTQIDPRWRHQAGEGGAVDSPQDGSVSLPIGPTAVLHVTEKPPLTSPRENLSDVRIRTLLECGPLGASVQVGVLPERINPNSAAEVEISLPSEVRVQKIQGAELDQYQIIEHDQQTLIRLLLLTPESGDTAPVEITGYLPGTRSKFEIDPPRWIPSTVSGAETLAGESTSRRHSGQALVGVVPKPGFVLVDTTPRDEITPLSPQAFSDSLFAGMVWQIPDLAWSCSQSRGPSWSVRPNENPSRGVLSQLIDVRFPELNWSLDASLTSTESVPFEHVFAIDPRIDLQRATVQQNGADRLLRWKRTGDLVHLSIRDGQPGVQSVRLEGTVRVGAGPWAPLTCVYQSGRTSQSEVIVRTSPRTVTTLELPGSTLRLDPQAATSNREYRYQPESTVAPKSFTVEAIVEQRDALAWLDVVPQSESLWTLTFRTQWPEQSPSDTPVEVRWNQQGLEDLHQVNRREVVRPVAAGETILWRPVTSGGRPAELTLSATLRSTIGDRLVCGLPEVSGLRWKMIWVSLPRNSGFRPSRAQSALLSEPPENWSETWKEGVSTSRSDLYATQSPTSPSVTLDRSAIEPLFRPVLAETLIWMGGNHADESDFQYGVTKYQLISERETTLRIPEASRSLIRAISVDGRTTSAGETIRIPSRPSDLSHEVVVWWKSSGLPDLASPPDLVEIPDFQQVPHWIGVIPQHQKVLIGSWGNATARGVDYWIDRCESLLDGAAIFEGASWTVDGPLMHALTNSRDELLKSEPLTESQRGRIDRLEQRWLAFSQSGGSITSPLPDSSSGRWESGLDATLALCGESRSLWVRSNETAQEWPRLVDRRWAIAITAVVASIVSLVVLIWLVRIFRKLDIAEKLAARPNGAMIGLGVVWWVVFSPSVFGLLLVFWGLILWARDQALIRASSQPIDEKERQA